MVIICSPKEDKEIIQILYYSTNGLSTICSIMVLMAYVLLPNLRNNWLMRYLAYLNISNLFFGIISIIYVYYEIFLNQSTPTPQFSTALFSAYFCFNYSSLIWPLILAINLYQIVAKRNNNLSRYEFHCLFIGFIIPIIISLILGSSGFINTSSDFNEAIIYLIPVILMVIVSLMTYIQLIRALKFAFEEEGAKRFIKMILPYPLISVSISASVFAFDILYSNGGCTTLLSSIFLSIKLLQGAFDALVFSFNPTVRIEIKSYFKKSDEAIDRIELNMSSISQEN